jgi:hypothetical protein
MKKGTVILIVCSIFAALLYLLFLSTKRKALNDYKIFYSANLKGKIIDKYASSGGERFILDNSPQEFRFQSKMSVFNNFNTFEYTAENGDSVIKPAFSDTLIVIKNKSGIIYKYDFFETEK